MITPEKTTTELIAQVRALDKAATPGEWELCVRSPRSVETAHLALCDAAGRVIADTFNAEDQEIHSEPDDGVPYYFENGKRKRDMELIAAYRALAPELARRLEESQACLKYWIETFEEFVADEMINTWEGYEEKMARAKQALGEKV